MPSRRSRRLRWVAALVQVGLVAFIGGAFWWQNGRYAVPTPRPIGWPAPAAGAVLTLPTLVDATDPRPTVVHVFDPACPCSRFNHAEFLELVAEHGGRFRWVALAVGDGASDFPPDVAVVLDRNAGLAKVLGIHTTPQVALVGPGGGLWFRGNYNRTSFCADPATAFVRLALADCAAGRAVGGDWFDRPALGCPIVAAAE